MTKKASAALQHPTGRAVNRKKLSDSNNDLKYWLAQSPEVRLAALEQLRRQYDLLVKMELTQDFKEFVKLLNTCHAEYIIAGGYAVALYGYPRYTGDIDIWVNPTPENAVNVLNALQKFGCDDTEVNLEDLTTAGVVVQLGYPPNRIDLATGLTGVDFDSCWKNKIEIPYGDTIANFISLKDLKRNKKATARQQDLLDLQNLPD
ncbi:hypothetical protein ACFSKU_00055 [Pontibacter silvestris]|uniref:Nucleotidyltransferase n=1 Tax=Pontibacter silvestris TaxID=2305183 RepID=A0ABW4WTX1_9BACT|nr:hypothetical protein [Pontibacter silvestris]MCC9138895.1 hypothetical protein [Pontibacter silvestris]